MVKGILKRCRGVAVGLLFVFTAVMPLPARAQFGETVLKLGMSGEDVVILQTKLAALGYDVGPADGTFGKRTRAAVMVFQSDQGLEPDGVVGARTYQHLMKVSATSVYTVEDGDSLSNIAQRYGTTVETLAQLNNLSDPSRLTPGQKLKLPVARVSRAGGSRNLAYNIASTARRYLGIPYVWGGASPDGFDCSGFTVYVFAQYGIKLPRPADEQFETGIWVEKKNLQPGDLVFFSTYAPGASHVGIYIGQGLFIHASSGAGEVTITPLNKHYYVERYLGARRIVR